MIAAGVTPIAIIQGTENRWFYKYSEVRRALELKETIETFFETYNIPENLSSIEEEDWAMLMVYENAMRAIVEAAKVLEGELYPTASSVIPFLDTIIEDLKKLSNKVKLGVERNYVNTLLTNLQSNQRFPDGYKCETPYNILTLLDPRHSDLYFNEEQYNKSVYDLYIDSVYDDMKINGAVLSNKAPSPDPPVCVLANPQDSLAQRRAALLAKKKGNGPVTQGQGPITLKDKLQEELSKYLELRGCIDLDKNPMDWWRINHKSFQLLSMFWKAHSAFPATSTSAERAFSMDGLIFQPTR